ncbi:secreted protein [Streptomyces lividans TK24]|nr:secreted protein [Streptomyces lividans TK24]
MHPPTGMVTETPDFAGAGLPALPALVFGGHDTVDCPLPKRAEALAAGGVLPHGLPSAVHAELAAADREIRPGGPLPGDTRDEEELIAAFAADITDFARRSGVDRTVVVNVASTEPAPAGGALPASSLYAAAALRAGCPYVNFTPSTGLHHPALSAPAEASGLPYAGRDGKTGQTLLRSVLGPMFAQRALAVRAWSGTNLLGGGDGAALADLGGRRGEERRQGTRAGRHPRSPRRGRGPHRRRARARRLEDRLGPHRLRRLPRRPHVPPDHLAGLRLVPRRAARPGPGPPGRPRPPAGPVRPPGRTGLLLQGPGGGRPVGPGRAVRGAETLRRAAARGRGRCPRRRGRRRGRGGRFRRAER